MDPRHYSFSSTDSYANSYASSIFSRSSGASVSTVSAPDTVHGHYPAAGGLPCEFIGYNHCEQNFALDDVENWIDHIITDHLQGVLPKKVVCWFCDDFLFDSKHTAGRRQNFNNRMWHIREHILIEGMSVHNIRPDHYFNAHLRDSGLISENTYLAVRRYTEVPQGNYVLSHNAITPVQETRNRRQAYEYINPHDEERDYRRHQHRSRRSRA
ncbi:hypothetical protein GGS24DRAFT_436758 [Hypoxylon argillaceum]|nr:hypothetical protein GGS24DRAFT_436758 [Hypoxylon argillaceum]KAI1147229.1 hypothetical protein F4825DRAFT_159004 [Nemania diffusa]